MSQVVSQEAVIRLLVEKGIFSKAEFLEMVKVVNLEIGKEINTSVQSRCKQSYDEINAE